MERYAGVRSSKREVPEGDARRGRRRGAVAAREALRAGPQLHAKSCSPPFGRPRSGSLSPGRLARARDRRRGRDRPSEPLSLRQPRPRDALRTSPDVVQCAAALRQPVRAIASGCPGALRQARRSARERGQAPSSRSRPARRSAARAGRRARVDDVAPPRPGGAPRVARRRRTRRPLGSTQKRGSAPNAWPASSAPRVRGSASRARAASRRRRGRRGRCGRARRSGKASRRASATNALSGVCSTAAARADQAQSRRVRRAVRRIRCAAASGRQRGELGDRRLERAPPRRGRRSRSASRSTGRGTSSPERRRADDEDAAGRRRSAPTAAAPRGRAARRSAAEGRQAGEPARADASARSLYEAFASTAAAAGVASSPESTQALERGDAARAELRRRPAPELRERPRRPDAPRGRSGSSASSRARPRRG